MMNSVCILATGGTMDKDHVPVAEALVFSKSSFVPAMLEEFRALGIAHEIVMLKDSLELIEADRKALKRAVLARSESGVVITHGTSTMAVTAEYLKARIHDKTVVLTGAMRPFSLFKSDAGFNLGGAIIAAQTMPCGTYIVMNGKVFKAGSVRKNESKGIFEAL